jgi:folate-binding protein YgfZ
MTSTDAAALVRTGAGLFDLTASHGVVMVSGPDAVAFLQPITSNDVTDQPVGHLRHNALLNKQSGVIAEFHLLRGEQEQFLITGRSQVSRILETLDGYHFAEDVSIRDATSEYALIGVQGPESASVLQSFLKDPFFDGDYVAQRSVRCAWLDSDVNVVAWSLTGDEGYVLMVAQDAHAAAASALASKLDVHDLDTLRVEAGIPRYGVDIDESTRILDTGLGESTVDFDKGCFPGQEIVARIKSRGEVSRKLMGVVFEDEPRAEPGSEIFFEDKQVGTLRSVVFSPHLKRFIAFAYLTKQTAGRSGKAVELQIGGRALAARIVDLPFYKSTSIHAAAARVCDEALKAYHRDDFETARGLFERSLEILSDHADALEGLGMTLERMGDLDAAIRVNSRYADQHPMAVMAHTNLSRLYMFKGLKEEAEDEQAKATMIKFRQASGQSAGAEELEAERRKELEAERERKSGIFNQVLELDPEDEVANFGLGSIALESGDPQGATQHLEIVVRNNERYSVAYELLGRALVALERGDEAASVLQRGINVAQENGDLMPLQAMERQLAGLKGEANE